METIKILKPEGNLFIVSVGGRGCFAEVLEREAKSLLYKKSPAAGVCELRVRPPCLNVLVTVVLVVGAVSAAALSAAAQHFLLSGPVARPSRGHPPPPIPRPH